MMTEELKRDCDNLEIDYNNFDTISMREVIVAYRRKAFKVHPDKVDQESTEERTKATAAFQALNSSYQRILTLMLQNKYERENDHENDEEEGDLVADDDERFIKDNFKNCNFPHENDGSFTVIIQHDQADYWQESLEVVYGQPHIAKNDKGTECDRYWKFFYEFEGEKTNITIHIYNKPKTKKASKLLIQGGAQNLICLFVFNVLPRIYRDVCKSKPNVVLRKGSQNLRSMVACGQCKVKATMTGMKMHLKTAHSKQGINQSYSGKKKQTKPTVIGKEKSAMFHCDNCGYKAMDRKILMQHIDAIHLIPWNSRMDQINRDIFKCSKCEFVATEEEQLSSHAKVSHAVASEQLLDEGAEQDLEEIELEEGIREIEGSIEERECPTPIPDSVFICAECNNGFKTIDEVETHIRNQHPQIPWEEQIQRLESELRLEKGQHQDHLKMLEVALKESSSYRIQAEQLQSMTSDLEKERNVLKAGYDANEMILENVTLKKVIEEKEKDMKRIRDKNSEEVKELKKQLMQTSESLRSAVLERENLRENDRILLNTLDMMKIYVDQVKSKESKLDVQNVKCGKCNHTANSSGEMKEHQKTAHVGRQEDAHQGPYEQDEGLVYCCTKCRFETTVERKLTDHIKKKHETFNCEECDAKLETRSRMEEHKKKEHSVIECDMCNFKTKRRHELDVHIQNLHNKMFSCKECSFEAISSRVLKDHLKNQHQTEAENFLSCDNCGYKTIMENNLNEHKKNKHKEENMKNPRDNRRDEKLENIPCIYWNHGYCSYDVNCKFAHVEIPACHYQDDCRKTQCTLHHNNKSLNTFLGRSQVGLKYRKH